MGYAGSADIFQAEMMDLMESLEYVRAYIDDLLVITRGTLEDHLEKLGEVLKFVTTVNIVTPYLSPYGYPNEIPVGQKSLLKNVLIPWYPILYLTIASSAFLGAYGSLPDAAIWWCLRTGGGGVLTRPVFPIYLTFFLIKN
jgi:hypothetical protein